MLSSLGFDTVIVNNQSYDDDSLALLFELLVPLDVINYIFAFDFDLTLNAVSLHNERLKKFKSRASSLSPRGVHIFAFSNVLLDKGFSLNKDINRLKAVKSPPAMISSLPLFADKNYDVIARDVNQIIYRKHNFLLISNFKQVLETSSYEFCQKLLSAKGVGFGIDINYLFDPAKLYLAKDILKFKSDFIPTISHHISNYVGIVNEAQHFLDIFGKKDYYDLFRRVRKCSTHLGF